MIILTEADVMVDVETLGKHPGCAILSIGACSVLHPEKQFYVVCSDPLECGLSADSDTLRWWLRQSDSARGALQEQDRSEPTRQALTSFAAWLNTCFQTPRVWSYGAAFDLPIIHAAGYKLLGWSDPPWGYRRGVCLRTHFEHVDRPDVPAPEGAHNALVDAQYQAKLLLFSSGACI